MSPTIEIKTSSGCIKITLSQYSRSKTATSVAKKKGKRKRSSEVSEWAKNWKLPANHGDPNCYAALLAAKKISQLKSR